MLRVRRRCVQTAHISLHSFNFQRAQTQNRQHTPTSGVSPIAHPIIPCDPFQNHSPFPTSTSLRRVVFGEALSTETHQNPQEGKDKIPTFFCHDQRLKGISAHKIITKTQTKTQNQPNIPPKQPTNPNPKPRIPESSRLRGHISAESEPDRFHSGESRGAGKGRCHDLCEAAKRAIRVGADDPLS